MKDRHPDEPAPCGVSICPGSNLWWPEYTLMHSKMASRFYPANRAAL